MASMDDNPNTVESGKPRRRWFQFRLRTLLIGVALLGAACSYVAHEVKFVRDRQVFLNASLSHFCFSQEMTDDDTTITGVRRWLGDTGMKVITFMPLFDGPPENSDEELRTARRLFPEARVVRVGSDE